MRKQRLSFLKCWYDVLLIQAVRSGATRAGNVRRPGASEKAWDFLHSTRAGMVRIRTMEGVALRPHLVKPVLSGPQSSRELPP